MTPDAGTVAGIWLKRFRRGPMDAADRAILEVGSGIRDDVNRGRREVTVIEEEVWRVLMEALGASVDPAARRANIMVRGVPLRESRGRILQLGPARVEVLGETRPCERMDEAWPGLQAAMRAAWAGGAYGRVIEGGIVAVGDRVGWAS